MAEEDRKRFLLSLAYDGRIFEGWQSQVGGNTVQDHLLKALKGVCPQIESVQGSGRTDAGVSAMAQRAHFDAPASARLDVGNWQKALNAHLPPQIRVMDCEQVDLDFHARFNATGKCYRYRLFEGAVLPPLQHGLVWQVRGKLDRDLLHEAAKLFAGRHDFRAFSANRGDGHDETRDAQRMIHSVEVLQSQQDPLVDLRFKGEGFLYKMVRFIVGSMVRCAQGKLDPAEIQRLLVGVDFSEKAPFCAPADGLMLEQVYYLGNKSMTSSSSPAISD